MGGNNATTQRIALLLSAGKPVIAGRAGDDDEWLAILRLHSDWMFSDGLEPRAQAQ